MNGRLSLAKAWAFLKRDFRIASSYQLNFILTSLYSVFILIMLFFIGGMVDPESAGLGEYGGSYFAFALVGYGFYQYFQLALTSFSNSIQREQMSGCLEAMVGTRTKPETSIILSSFYGMISNLVQLFLIFILGAILFRVDLRSMNIPAAALAFVLSVAVFISFGIFSAAFIVVLKKGDPITWLLTTANFIFGGAFFPVEQMPGWMGTIAKALPATYALDALRASMINGAGIHELGLELGVLGGMALVLLPAGLAVFRLSVRKAKREGSLVFY